MKICKMGFCKNEVVNRTAKSIICLSCVALTMDCRSAGADGPLFTVAIGKMLGRARGRKRHEVSITADDIYNIWPESNCCPVMGVPFVTGEPRRNSPSLDRIDPTKGYEVGNIQIISDLANKMKQNATEQELERFCKYYG